MTATSDEDGGGPFGDESHDHASPEEALACEQCDEYCSGITGFMSRKRVAELQNKAIRQNHSRGAAGKNLHCIPVGNSEPIHQCHADCWCFPSQDTESENLYVHHAKDCREKWERQGVETSPDSLWVTVEEKP